MAVACGGAGANDDVGVIITPIEAIDTPAAAPPQETPFSGASAQVTSNGGAATATRPVSGTTPAAANGNGGGASLTGFGWPVSGGCLPRGDQLMPNAPRPYRNGTHEGVDFYPTDNCTIIAKGTSVLSAKAGTVIRADLDYKDITAADVAKYSANPNTEEALDNFRGRQVWVDHGIDANGNRIVTRYCHLSAIAPGITRGTQVAKGQLVAMVGESGTPESVTNPGSEMHLHFEIRVNDGYLGKGLPASQVRALYVAAFGP